jgi:hypothetical protein
LLLFRRGTGGSLLLLFSRRHARRALPLTGLLLSLHGRIGSSRTRRRRSLLRGRLRGSTGRGTRLLLDARLLLLDARLLPSARLLLPKIRRAIFFFFLGDAATTPRPLATTEYRGQRARSCRPTAAAFGRRLLGALLPHPTREAFAHAELEGRDDD